MQSFDLYDAIRKQISKVKHFNAFSDLAIQK